MKYLIYSLFSIFSVLACSKKPVETLPSDSIYNLSSTWQNQDNKTIKFREFIGKNMVVVMIYTSCKTACPILVADMKKIKAKIPENLLEQTNLVLVSIDPEVDTPEKLNAFAKNNKMKGAPYIFLRSSISNTQEFANVLSMKYKKISPMDFSHSNIISIFNKKGELVTQEQGAGINADKVVKDLQSIKD